MLRSLFVCLLLAGFAPRASAEIYRVGPDDDWFALLSGDELQPGDEVILGDGTYTDARRLVIQHRGSSDQPIIIRGAANERAVFRRPDARQNTLNLEGAQYLHLRNFEVTGGAAGIRIRPRGDEPVRGDHGIQAAADAIITISSPTQGLRAFTVATIRRRSPVI